MRAGSAKYDLSTIAGRLRWGIERRPARGRARGVRMFQRDIEALSKQQKEVDDGADVPGVTLPSIMTYLNDETVPSVLFLKAAAEILDVREAWLISGHGEPTAEAENVREAQAGMAYRGQVISGAPFLSGILAPAAFIHAMSCFSEHFESESEEWLAVPQRLAESLMSPLQAFRFRYREGGPEFQDYVQAMLHALVLSLEVDRVARRWDEDFGGDGVRDPSDWSLTEDEDDRESSASVENPRP